MNPVSRSAASTRAARGVRMVKLIHLALLALGIGLLALALLLRVTDPSPKVTHHPP